MENAEGEPRILSKRLELGEKKKIDQALEHVHVLHAAANDVRAHTLSDLRLKELKCSKEGVLLKLSDGVKGCGLLRKMNPRYVKLYDFGAYYHKLYGCLVYFSSETPDESAPVKRVILLGEGSKVDAKSGHEATFTVQSREFRGGLEGLCFATKSKDTKERDDWVQKIDAVSKKQQEEVKVVEPDVSKGQFYVRVMNLISRRLLVELVVSETVTIRDVKHHIEGIVEVTSEWQALRGMSGPEKEDDLKIKDLKPSDKNEVTIYYIKKSAARVREQQASKN